MATDDERIGGNPLLASSQTQMMEGAHERIALCGENLANGDQLRSQGTMSLPYLVCQFAQRCLHSEHPACIINIYKLLAYLIFVWSFRDISRTFLGQSPSDVLRS